MLVKITLAHTFVQYISAPASKAKEKYKSTALLGHAVLEKGMTRAFSSSFFVIFFLN